MKKFNLRKSLNLKKSLMAKNSQLNKIKRVAEEIGCSVYVDLRVGSCYSQEQSNPYISLDSDELDSMGVAVLTLLHELGHYFEAQRTGLALKADYEETPEDVICCEILAWAYGIYIGKMLGIPLMRGYREMVRYCLYSYCAQYHKDFEKRFRFAVSGELNALKLPHNPVLKEQVDMFLEKL